MSSVQTTPPNWEKIAAFVFGVVFLLIMLVIAIAIPNPTKTQWFVFRVALAAAASGIGAVIPGLIDLQIPGYIRAGGAIALFVLVYKSNPAVLVATPPDDYNGAENKVIELKHQVGSLDTRFEAIQRDGDVAKREVNDGAPKVAQQLMNIQADKLRLAVRILRLEYACNAWALAAATETDAARKIEYARSAQDGCKQAKDQIRVAQQSKDKDDQAQRVIEWIVQDGEENRIDFYRGMAICIEGRAKNDAGMRSEARVTILGIPASYRQRFSPEKDEALNWCVKD
jgi:hypothetical protein